MSTIYDVAKLVGVSPSAVSAVLSDRPVRVSVKTRQRIIEGAKTLGYRTNRAAQQLKTGKFNTIAVCFEKAGNIFLHPVANQLMGGIGGIVSNNGLDLLFLSHQGFEESMDKLPSRGVDGGIVIGPVGLTKETYSAINECSIPLVCIDASPGFVAASTVDANNFIGMKMGVEHLIGQGHKKMAYISDQLGFQCLVDRMNGFTKAVEDAGLSIDDQMIRLISLKEVASVVRQLVESVDKPSALICADGRSGRAVLDEVGELGLDVPGDLVILTYDDISGRHPLAEATDMVVNNDYKIGEAAADLLIKLINAELVGPVSLRLPPELVLHTHKQKATK